MKTFTYLMFVVVMSLTLATPAMAQEESETDLAKKLSNFRLGICILMPVVALFEILQVACVDRRCKQFIVDFNP